MVAGRPDSSLLAALMSCPGWQRVTCPPGWFRSFRGGWRDCFRGGRIEGRDQETQVVAGASCRPSGVAPRLFRRLRLRLRLRLPVNDVASSSMQGMGVDYGSYWISAFEAVEPAAMGCCQWVRLRFRGAMVWPVAERSTLATGQQGQGPCHDSPP